MFDPSKLIEGLKLPTKTFVALCIAAGLLLFSTDSFLKVLGLELLVNDHRPYVGALFVISLCLSVVAGLATFAKFVNPWLVEAHWVRLGKKRLQNLNPEEKEIISYYISNQTRSQQLDFKSGSVNVLVREKIIFRGSNVGTYYGFDFVIQPWAWEYLNENPHLLD